MKIYKFKSLSHKNIRDGLWYDGTHSFIIAAKDGVWLYNLLDEKPRKAELLTNGNFKKHKRFRGSDIFSLSQNPVEKSMIGYCMLDAYVGLIDVNTKEVISFNFGKRDQFPLDFWFSPDGNMLAASHDQIILWDTNSRKPNKVAEIQNHGSPICWDNNESILICNDETGDILFFDLRKQKIIKSISGKNFNHECVKLRVSESYLVAIFVNGTIKLWNKKTLNMISEIHFSKLFTDVTIHPDENFVVAWHPDFNPQIYSLPNLEPMCFFEEPTAKVVIWADKLAMIKNDSIDFFKMELPLYKKE